MAAPARHSGGLAPPAGRAVKEQAPPPPVVRPGAGWDGASPREAVPGSAGSGKAGLEHARVGRSGSVNGSGNGGDGAMSVLAAPASHGALGARGQCGLESQNHRIN